MASLPKIKQEILQVAFDEVLKSKQKVGLTLSEQERKVIVCALVSAAYSSGGFEAEENQLLEYICPILGVGINYLEQFSAAIAQLFQSPTRSLIQADIYPS